MRAHGIAAALALAASCCAAPLSGPNLEKRHDGVEPLNEPCYVHDSACAGYPVCCVKKGTCVVQHSGTISSNTDYYEGGCQSLESRYTEWSEEHGNAECTQQGECLVQHLQVCKGGTAVSPHMEQMPSETLARLMVGSCEADCPSSSYGHGSYGSHGGGDEAAEGETTTTTKTTTTTFITQVTGYMQVSLSSVSAVGDAQVELMLRRTIAALAGYGTDHSFTSVVMPDQLASTFTLEYQLDVSSAEDVSAAEAELNLAAATDAQIAEELGMRVGTCDYTLAMSQMSRDRESSGASLMSSASGATLALIAALAAAARGGGAHL